tara:strand:+ start:115 stop:495 length:381 start_codon:yes stop_codon:yes gene_type:complete
MKKQKNSNRSFGILFFLIFLLIGIWPLLDGEKIRFWSVVISLIFLILGLFYSKVLAPLKKVWIKLGEILGKIIAPIVMALVYFIILSPISFIIRFLGKDLLKLKFTKDNSYWIKREKKIGSMKKQF